MSTIKLRELQWPDDVEKLDVIDTSITVDVLYDVLAGSRGFSMVERAVAPSSSKRYAVDWREFAQAKVALVAERDGAITGVASLNYESWNRRAIISHLYIDRCARRQGIGTHLLHELRTRAVDHDARQLFVETQNTNVPAIHFYERNGFTLVGLDTSLYDGRAEGEAALFFAVNLLAQPNVNSARGVAPAYPIPGSEG